MLDMLSRLFEKHSVGFYRGVGEASTLITWRVYVIKNRDDYFFVDIKNKVRTKIKKAN